MLLPMHRGELSVRFRVERLLRALRGAGWWVMASTRPAAECAARFAAYVEPRKLLREANKQSERPLEGAVDGLGFKVTVLPLWDGGEVSVASGTFEGLEDHTRLVVSFEPRMGTIIGLGIFYGAVAVMTYLFATGEMDSFWIRSYELTAAQTLAGIWFMAAVAYGLQLHWAQKDHNLVMTLLRDAMDSQEDEE